MFARVFNTARGILSRSPSAQGRTSKDTTPSDIGNSNLTDDMVTTRQGTEVDNTPRSTPRSTRKGKRALDAEAESTPTEPKRSRRSTRSTNVDLEEEQPAMVEVTSTPILYDSIEFVPLRPTSAKKGHSREEKLPVRVRKSPKGRVVKEASPNHGETVTEIPSSTQETEFYTPIAKENSSLDETPALKKEEKDISPTPRAKVKVEVVVKTPASGKKRKMKNSPVTDVQENQEQDMVAPESTDVPKIEDSNAGNPQFPDEIPSSTFDSEKEMLSTQNSRQEPAQAVPPPSTKAHIRFDSEEPVDTQPIVLSQPARTRFIAEEEDDSDSDEAPEEVTVASALSKTKAAEQDAARAFKAQQEKEKKKREERLLRIQKDQEKKRQKEEKKAKKLAKALSGQASAEAERASLDIDMHNLPALLPDSLLETIGDKRPRTPPPTLPGKSAAEVQKEKLNRHIRFLERGEKPIKRVKKGPVFVEVLQEQNKFLAPKVNRDGKHVRERYLQGRQVERKKAVKGKMERKKMHRKAVGGGFLRGED